jgi:hypothetical protein
MTKRRWEEEPLLKTKPTRGPSLEVVEEENEGKKK